MTEPIAVIDCGSNSTRLLIADQGGEVARREMRITRLSQGVDESGTLVDEALERSYAVLREYRSFMDNAGVSRGLLVATSAVRDATNGPEFLEEARRLTGVVAEILSGDQEASYSYAGAVIDLAPDPRTTVIVDIGGGSTEVAMMLSGALCTFSMQLGCVRVSERALGRGPVTPESEAAARTMIEREIERAWAAVPAFSQVSGQVRLVGLAGTVATLAQLDAHVSEYRREAVHHRRLSRATVQEWRDQLAHEAPEVRLAHPGMVAGREDVMPAGLYVLDAIMNRFGAEELLTSENDILDGIAIMLLGA